MLQLLICPELMSFVTCFERSWLVGKMSWRNLKAHPNVYILIEIFKHTQF